MKGENEGETELMGKGRKEGRKVLVGTVEKLCQSRNETDLSFAVSGRELLIVMYITGC